MADSLKRDIRETGLDVQRSDYLNLMYHIYEDFTSSPEQTGLGRKLATGKMY